MKIAMLEALRQLRKSKAERRQEAISAYLDNELSAAEMRQFEQRMAADAALRHDVEQQQFVKLNLSRMPRFRAPRRFTLDPKQYGRPVAQSYFTLYPAMRVATALAGIFFVIAIGIEFLSFDLGAGASRQADQVSLIQGAEPAAEMMVEDETAMGEGEGPLKFQQLPETSLDNVEEMLETELAAEEAAPVEAPAEEAVQAAEAPIIEESEIAAEEAVTEGEVTEEEIMEEGIVQSLLPTPEAGEDAAALALYPPVEPEVTPIFPTGGGGERPEEPAQEAAGTAPAERAGPAVTGTATSQPSLTPFSTLPPDQEVARAQEIITVQVPTLESAVEAEQPPILTRQLPPEPQEPAPEVPVMRLVIAALGIAVIFLAAVTLLLRQQTKL